MLAAWSVRRLQRPARRGIGAPPLSRIVAALAVLAILAALVVIAAALRGMSRTPTAVTPRFLILVISGTRSKGVDYASNLVRSIRDQDPDGVRARLVLFDTDPVDARRPASWFAALPPATLVAHPSSEPLDLLLDRARDKYHDTPERIRWRAKSSRNMRDALVYGSRSGFRHVVVLEDDVRVSSSFLDGLDRLVRADDSSTWLAWTLMNPADFDHGRVYAHGDPYMFEACTQGMLYNNDGDYNSSFAGLIDHFSRVWRDDPTDFIIRDFQRSTSAVVYVALPNLVQHVGAVSTLGSKKAGEGVVTGCVSRSFRE